MTILSVQVVPLTESGLPSKSNNQVRSRKAGQSQSQETNPSQSCHTESHARAPTGDGTDIDLTTGLNTIRNDFESNDKEKLWVEKMNKLNTQRSREEREEPDNNEGTRQESEETTEFSPIVYWKEPLPEVLPLDLDEQKKSELDTTDLSLCQTTAIVTVTNTPSSTTSSLYRTAGQSKEIASSLVRSVWLDKYKFEEAEVKYFSQQEDRQRRTEAERKVTAEPTTEVKIDKLSEQIPIRSEEHEEDDELTYEDHLEIIKSDNLEMRESLRTLTDVVFKLQERVKHLEDSNNKQSVKH